MIKFKHLTIVILGIWAFAFFLQYPFPEKFISISGLLAGSIILGTDSELFSHVLGRPKNRIVFIISMILCISLGIIIAIILRHDNQLSLFPKTFTFFAILAIMIGATEELIFRGWLQSVMTVIFKKNSIILSSLVHSIFKTLIFVSPVVRYQIDIQQLFIYTLLGGLILGFSRLWSGSIWPALTAHVLFDFIVYGDVSTWPWWVG